MTSSLRFRVRYAETDAMGVAHHSNYIIWFEMGRVTWMDEIGLPYIEIEADGIYLVVSKIELTYRRAARFDEELVLKTTLVELKSRRIRFVYQLENSSGDLVAEGATEHIPTNTEHRTVMVSESIRRALEPWVSR